MFAFIQKWQSILFLFFLFTEKVLRNFVPKCHHVLIMTFLDFPEHFQHISCVLYLFSAIFEHFNKMWLFVIDCKDFFSHLTHQEIIEFVCKQNTSKSFIFAECTGCPNISVNFIEKVAVYRHSLSYSLIPVSLKDKKGISPFDKFILKGHVLYTTLLQSYIFS